MFSVDYIHKKTEKDLEGKYFRYFLFVLVLYILFLIVNFLKPDKAFSFIFFEFIIFIIIIYYLANMNLNIAKNKEKVTPNIGSVIGSSFNAIIISIRAILLILLGFVCFIVPGSFAIMWYSQGFYIYLEDKSKTPKQCLLESRLIMEPHISKFLDLQISFLPEVILGFLTFGLAFIWVIPMMQVSHANFYLFVKEDYKRQLEIEKEKGIIRHKID